MSSGADLPQASGPDRPSRLYRAEIWRLGLVAVRLMPPAPLECLGRALAWAFWTARPARRAVVIQNLLPAMEGDRVAARETARRLYRNFGRKVADLWRYESGQSVDHLFAELTGRSLFMAALESGRGILLLTPHLGNWEFGAPLLRKLGFDLLAVTLEEPHAPLTELRRASRARWGIQTLVIQRDPFAFLEVIRRLEAGAMVALLVDRPPTPTAVTVELFGRPFAASVAAAELARASGCVLLPVYVPHTDRGYGAHVLPEIPYERAALRQPEARRRLTQEIMRAFEPVIRQHADQWYHFVPVWPAPAPVEPHLPE
jgi:KDO2-lipid IV(A) lauroyltransferase